jgi:anti-sigma B factor antagonist
MHIDPVSSVDTAPSDPGWREFLTRSVIVADILHLSARPDSAFRLRVVDTDPLRASIRAAGELDLAARDSLTELLQEQLLAGRRVINFDLSEVTFLDCSCIGVLVGAHHRFLERHGLLILAGIDARVARVLKLTGLDGKLFIAPTPTGCITPVAS